MYTLTYSGGFFSGASTLDPLGASRQSSDTKPFTAPPPVYKFLDPPDYGYKHWEIFKFSLIKTQLFVIICLNNIQCIYIGNMS